jgi:hypothetical protein
MPELNGYKNYLGILYLIFVFISFDKVVISSVARNLIVLLMLKYKISPFGRNDKKEGFSFRH